VFFKEQTVPALSTAIEEFEADEHRIQSKACRNNALRFGTERFRSQLHNYVEAQWQQFQAQD
jgi:hypothetical protein